MLDKKEIINLIEKSLEVSAQFVKKASFPTAEIVLDQTIRVCLEQKVKKSEVFQLAAIVKQKLNKNKEAVEYFKKAILYDKNNFENYNNLGLTYSLLKKPNKSMELIEKAIHLNKKCHYLYSNLGLQYKQLKKHDIAIKYFKKSNKLKKDEKNYCMIAGCYAEQKDFKKALYYFKKSLEVNPDFVPSHSDMSYILLANQKWEEGWREYEWRFENNDSIKQWESIFEKSKKWTGQSLNDKKILISCEQGIGDYIHFFRYVKLLRKYENVKIIIYCPPDLKTLFAPHVDEVCSEITEYDFYASVCSLPHLLKEYSIDTSPYLDCDKKINLDQYSNYFKIGIVWAGNPQHPNDCYRSCYLKYFSKICNLSGVKVFAIQKDQRSRKYHFSDKIIDYTKGSEKLNLIDLSKEMTDFQDTAAILKSLDLVISVDTSVVHLAGAMGIPTWILLAKNYDWRWGDKKETQWYSNQKLFKQKELGKWRSVFDEVETKLKELICQKK